MFQITYLQLIILITLLWIATQSCKWIIQIKKSSEKISPKTILNRELSLLMVYICIIVIVRIVYFPWHHVDGHIGPLIFDSSKILPLWINYIPLVRLSDVYDGWQMNIIGNISMFIPVGIVWPLCFKKLNKFWKTLLAGSGFSLIIEITQLAFYQRSTDIDDLILNSGGVLIGALLYFGIKKLIKIFGNIKNTKK
ncbi:MAG: VanZ family protein [Treponema sp.]|nr:VanZ family protein [Treponema sp.]